MNTFKKYPKSWMILATVLFVLIVVVMGGHFSDAAHTPFWWKFWIVAQVLFGIAIVGAWAYLWFGGKKDIE